MAVPVFPATLPRSLQDGFQIVYNDGRIVFRNDAGPPNIRRRFSSVTKSVSLSYELTKAQLDTFNTFYETTVKQGTLPFTMTNPIDAAVTWLVTFGMKLPVVTNRATRYTVSFEVTVLPS